MKKDFLFQRQHDDVKEMLEKQVLYSDHVLRHTIQITQIDCTALKHPHTYSIDREVKSHETK